MNQPLDLSVYSVRTDLAVEAHEMAIEERLQQKKETSSPIEGVTIHDREIDGIKLSYVEVTEEGAQSIGKKPGTYITLEAQGIREQDTELQKKGRGSVCERVPCFFAEAEYSKRSKLSCCGAWK